MVKFLGLTAILTNLDVKQKNSQILTNPLSSFRAKKTKLAHFEAKGKMEI